MFITNNLNRNKNNRVCIFYIVRPNWKMHSETHSIYFINKPPCLHIFLLAHFPRRKLYIDRKDELFCEQILKTIKQRNKNLIKNIIVLLLPIGS